MSRKWTREFPPQQTVKRPTRKESGHIELVVMNGSNKDTTNAVNRWQEAKRRRERLMRFLRGLR